MKADDPSSDRRRRCGGGDATSNGREQRYRFGAPRREWLAVLFYDYA